MGRSATVRERLETALRDACEDEEFKAWADQAVIGAHFKNASETKAYLQETEAKVQTLMQTLELTP